MHDIDMHDIENIIVNDDAFDVLPSIPSNSIDCIITDPPYLLSASARKSANKAIGWADINNSSIWYSQWMVECWRVMKKTAGFWIFCNWKTFPVYQCAASKIPGMFITSVLVWDREWPSVGHIKGLRQNYELVVLFSKPEFSIIDRKTSDIWKCKWASARPSGHPQEKPVSLIEKMIRKSGISEDSVILDPFMGSGSVGIAANNNKCTFYGIELEDMHYKKALLRLKNNITNCL